MDAHLETIVEFAVKRLKSLKELPYACDLHNELFNTGFLFEDDEQAKEFLLKYDIFKALDTIYQYEDNNGIEHSTNLSSPHHILGMLVYAIGEDLITQCPTIIEKWDDELTNEDCVQIESELYHAMRFI